MQPVPLLSLVVALPALIGAGALALPRRWVGLRVSLSTAAPAGALALLAWYAARFGFDLGAVSTPWMPSLNLALAFNADRLGLFFAFLVAGVGVLITLYARAYFGPDQKALYRFYPSLLLFMTAMLGLVLADNFLLMVVFWELTSVSSYLLIGWERDDPAAVKNALQAFVVTGLGGLALLGGVALLGLSSGHWSFSSLSVSPLAATGATTGALALIFLAVASKSAQWPLHFWLPGAMAAPTPVSAYLHSATMVKAGVYLLARLADPMSQLPLWPWLAVPVGAITMVLGAYLALRKFDLKLIFAYTTVSQLGLFVCLYGLSGIEASPGKPLVMWDITQILNHALYKAPLFLLAGGIAHVAFTRDLRDLFGLVYQGRTERIMTVLLLAAAYAMASGPGTLAFMGKEFFFYGLYHAWRATEHPLLLALMAAGMVQGLLNVAILVRLSYVLLSHQPKRLEPPHDPQAEEERVAFEDYHAIQTGFWLSMLWIPAAAILSLQFLGGLWPGAFDAVFGGFERHRVYFDRLPGFLHAILHPSTPLLMSGIAIVIGVAVGFLPLWRRNVRDVHDRLFPAFYRLATVGGGRVFGLIQSGSVRTYLAAALTVLVAIIGWAAWSQAQALRWPAMDQTDGLRATLPGYLMAVLLCASALVVPWMKRRSGQVIALGTVGYAVAGMLYVYKGPDLALTQISVEIVSLILFLLVLSLLPRSVPSPSDWRLPRLAIAVLVGGAMAWLTWSAATADRPPMPYHNAGGEPFAHAGEFFLRNSYEGIDTHGRNPGGGGANVVNVILVDFRGFDTFGEIMVLSLAAMGVWTLLRPHGGYRHTRTLRENLPPNVEPLPAGAPPGAGGAYGRRLALRTEPLRVMTLVLVPLSLLFAIHIYFKGHQTPGGGFVAGLVAAIAIIVHRMAHGRASLRHMMRIPERTLIGCGLLLAVITGAIPLFLGRPFLYSAFGYMRLPGTDDYLHLASVLGFDLGVFMVVAGVVLGMINAVSEETEEQ